LISDKTITYKEAIEFENIDELIKSIRQKEILEFSHSSFKDKIRFLNKKFNLTFPEIEKIQDEIIELFTTRNIILHNNGIVNQTYLKQNKKSKLKLGSKRVVDEDYTRNGIRNLRTIGYSIAGNVIEKINK
jgi:predicted nuclease with TOPRIM domain